MRKLVRKVISLVLSIVLLGVIVGTTLAKDKVGICHATGSVTNPYVFIEVAQAAVKAHIDKSTGNLHGDRLGNVDFYASSGVECESEPTPTLSPTPKPKPTPRESAVPTPSPGTPVAGPTSTPDSTPDTGPVTLPDTSTLGK